MPGVLQPFSVITPSGRQVDVAFSNESSQISALRSLECIQCRNITYNGRKIDGCHHTICQPCIDNNDLLATGEHNCDGIIVTGKTLTSYSIETKTLLDNLIVLCPFSNCNQKALLSDVDQHIRDHINPANGSLSEIQIANDPGELPPNSRWYELEGIIYYVVESNAQ
ncbi:hypothetical protein J7438_01470 [Thalassotalea sp. G20_0]|uniref:hypothetical protein n=1 Tax=Thalassotalea sp. G20_0 TaxID=2821093 RepID=UPI001ADB8E5E|nr:hypothetical protein [Thalassotalea sp. G20_0]MBO9492762.1 hypothetical protein [Thalassotalea sp. G20_0]